MDTIASPDSLPQINPAVETEQKLCPVCRSPHLQVIALRPITNSDWSDQDLQCACGLRVTLMVYTPDDGP